MVLIKFGKKEHLEQLRNGIVHFSSLESFQQDMTSYRGDRLEGKLLLDPSKPFLINGSDISYLIQRVELSYETDCPLLSFSASMLSKKNCHKLSNGLYTINESFIKEMEQFGDYFLIFNGFEFIHSLVSELSKTQTDYECHPLSYINKNNFQQISNHFSEMDNEEREFAHLFVKDTANSYPLQNEWRFVVFDIHNCYSTKDAKGTNIKTSFSTKMPVMEVENLLTLQCCERFLFN